MENYKILSKSIQVIREDIINHPVYSAIQSVEDLNIFMEHHVYAVWDFMSLLKSLQKNLTCVDVPWFPVGSGNTRFLINEIVVGEENDIDLRGEKLSHFEMYLNAMSATGANTEEILGFLAELKTNKELAKAFEKSKTNAACKNMVNTTFEVINTGKAYLQAAVFTLGREDLIPDMFHSIVNKLYEKDPKKIEDFKYYLDRHIEVDGGHHSHLAIEMTNELCGDDQKKWEEATVYVHKALVARKQLWDAVYKSIQLKQQTVV